jgi:hypothetical protein
VGAEGGLSVLVATVPESSLAQTVPEPDAPDSAVSSVSASRHTRSSQQTPPVAHSSPSSPQSSGMGTSE